MLRVKVAVAVFFANLVCGADDSKKVSHNEIVMLSKRYQMECIEETRVDADIIAKIKSRSWRIPYKHLHTAMQWALCVMMKRGLMTKEGVYKLDVALKMVPREDRDAAVKLIDLCLSQKAKPAEEIAFLFVKCFQKTKSNYTVSIFI